MAQPDYNGSEEERWQKIFYDVLADDSNLCLRDGVMNYIARILARRACSGANRPMKDKASGPPRS